MRITVQNSSSGELKGTLLMSQMMKMLTAWSWTLVIWIKKLNCWKGNMFSKLLLSSGHCSCFLELVMHCPTPHYACANADPKHYLCNLRRELGVSAEQVMEEQLRSYPPDQQRHLASGYRNFVEHFRQGCSVFGTSAHSLAGT